MAKNKKPTPEGEDEGFFKEPSKPTITVKLIEKIATSNIKIYQALDHRVYYEMDGKYYDRMPSMLGEPSKLHIFLKEISLEEFDRLYNLPK